MTEETIKAICYTKEEVDLMIEAAVAEARAIDEESMRKHNRDATIISMILLLPVMVSGLSMLLNYGMKV